MTIKKRYIKTEQTPTSALEKKFRKEIKCIVLPSLLFCCFILNNSQPVCLEQKYLSSRANANVARLLVVRSQCSMHGAVQDCVCCSLLFDCLPLFNNTAPSFKWQATPDTVLSSAEASSLAQLLGIGERSNMTVRFENTIPSFRVR